MSDWKPKFIDDWLAHAKAAEATASLPTLKRRLGSRIPELCAVAAVLLLLLLASALTPLGALAGAAGIAAIAMTVPVADENAAVALPPSAAYARRSGVETAAVWQTIVEAIPDAAIILDARGFVSYHNADARDLYEGLRVGAPFVSISRNPDILAALDRVASTGETSIAEYVERVPMERRFRAIVASLQGAERVLLRHEPEAPQMLLTLRDLSERDRLSEMRADFIANASHELRTPLASLRGFIETLQGPARNDEQARERFLGLMASQATRMTRLIDDLLSLSRVEMKAHIPPRGSVDLNEVAAHVAQTLQPLASSDRITITLTKSEAPAWMRGDRDEIVQVAANLVQNALKYGRADGHVRITVSRVPGGMGPRVLLSVADDGPGIAPEHLPRLTERFYRVSVASSREKGGTGLGLAIVKHIVSRHRGELRIESRLGEGSTFTAAFAESK